jgi:hypothetical protein
VTWHGVLPEQSGSSHGSFLADLAEQIDADRGSLLELMRVLKVRIDRVKVLGAWCAEKLGRLKLNGQLLGLFAA